MQRLFERIADQFEGTVRAEELRENYARLVFTEVSQKQTLVELFKVILEAVGPSAERLELIRVGGQAGDEPVLVSPIPSAVLAVALR